MVPPDVIGATIGDGPPGGARGSRGRAVPGRAPALLRTRPATSVVVPVAFVLGVPVAVVQVVHMVAVPHARVPAALAVPVLVPAVGHVARGLALVPVTAVLPVQMPVVDAVDVVAVVDAVVPAVRAVRVRVGGVFGVGGGHGVLPFGAAGDDVAQAATRTARIG
ncbi:hypothetical protein GCM10010269_17290 [Streptomyces humidus]|uniref:Uncharacterized protein n=1 Tax=Streptomyces humidus TaxID=52259 RepID=A0A918FSR0_9ACTN|nr:hypothetical protein GCM10010269_17290 [Streptomyces humidus]